MAYGFLDIFSTPRVRAAQAANGSLGIWEGFSNHCRFDRFTAAEAAFVQARDSFYMATVSASGWPYIQHRRGPVGFLKVVDKRPLVFADSAATASTSALARWPPTVAPPYFSWIIPISSA